MKMIVNLKKYFNSLFNFLSKLRTYTGANRINHKNAYFLPFIFTKLSPNITNETEPIITYTFFMFILNLIVLICFFNIVGYILSIYLVKKYDVETKFPKLKKYIIFYITTNKLLLVLEIIIAFVILIFIILVNFVLFTAILRI